MHYGAESDRQKFPVPSPTFLAEHASPKPTTSLHIRACTMVPDGVHEIVKAR
jgi:hypothetical protein